MKNLYAHFRVLFIFSILHLSAYLMIKESDDFMALLIIMHAITHFVVAMFKYLEGDYDNL